PRPAEADRGGRSGGGRSGGDRSGSRPSGSGNTGGNSGRPSGSGSTGGNSGRPPRERTHGSTDAVRESAEGGGTHDGTAPTRRRRTRSRRGGAGTPGNTPPAA
ncbi:MAG: Superfamily and helicase, partial [Microbacteriaceae bacterium]|nr:Superfamily and helicase [Microbacteriaceae bacterium]